MPDYRFWILLSLIGVGVMVSGLYIVGINSKTIYTVSEDVNPRTRSVLAEENSVTFENLSEEQETEFLHMKSGTNLEDPSISERSSSSAEIVYYDNETYIVRSNPVKPKNEKLYEFGWITTFVGIGISWGGIWKYRMCKLRRKIEQLEKNYSGCR